MQCATSAGCRRTSMRRGSVRLLTAGLFATGSAVVGYSGTALAADLSLVTTSSGTVQGSLFGNYRTFEGIPYAAPPVGSLRWAPPQPTAWTGVRTAQAFGSQCIQAGPLGPVGSEDCLFLNVVTPIEPGGVAPTNLPVMVFIHGGAFVSGSGDLYATPVIPTQGNVILVTLNYRLGVFGFMAHSALDVPGVSSGNYGLMDQAAALQWVQQNIAQFGGDPANVTLFGESAGAYSVCAQLASPAAHGLFNKAIVESGECTNPFHTLDEARAADLPVATTVGCASATDPTCLRAVAANTLFEAQQLPQFSPELDGRSVKDLPFAPSTGSTVVPLQWSQALATGGASFNAVPLMMGSTHDEMRGFVTPAQFLLGISGQDYENNVAGTDFSPKTTQHVLAQYPAAQYPTPLLAWYTVLTDWGGLVGACSQLATDVAVASRGTPVYAYEFSDVNSPNPANINPLFPYGAFHASELVYWTHNSPLLIDPLFFVDHPDEGTLSNQIVAYWTNFARTGNPNGLFLPFWPGFHSSTDVLQLNSGFGNVHPIDLSAEHQCAFWNNGLP